MRFRISTGAIVLSALSAWSGCNEIFGINKPSRAESGEGAMGGGGAGGSRSCRDDLTACRASDPCHVGTCDVASNTCVEAPGNDGAACADDDPCTLTGSCQGGHCVGGNPVDCSFLSSACAEAHCDRVLGCVAVAVNAGSPCDDGLFCTINDTCQRGACTGGGPFACDPPSNTCQISACDEATDQCTIVSGPSGVACDDQVKCTANDACQNGQCVGSAIVSCNNGDSCCPPGCTLAVDSDCNALAHASYDASRTFQDALPATTMTLTWNGAFFWSCSGGSQSGARYAKYDATGMLLGTYEPGIDFRSVFTKGDGTARVFARALADNVTRVQIGDGVFQNDITLSGGALDTQSGVVWNDATSEFVAVMAGVVSRWSQSGQFVGAVTLQGFGSMNSEADYPQNRGLIARGGYYLTYSNQVLSAWDAAGVRQKTTVLNGAGVSFDSYFSLSYAAGKVWIVDSAGGTWRGYDVGL